MELIATISIGAARRIGEIGFLIGAIGGLLLLLGSVRGHAANADARAIAIAAGLCIAVGFALGIVAFHWGPA